jgi:hypothetical protein
MRCSARDADAYGSGVGAGAAGGRAAALVGDDELGGGQFPRGTALARGRRPGGAGAVLVGHLPARAAATAYAQQRASGTVSRASEGMGGSKGGEGASF